MSRLRIVLSTILPSMLAGGLLLGSGFSHADVGRGDELGYWPASTQVAQADPRPRHRPPQPPQPPQPPDDVWAGSPSVPPAPPTAPMPPFLPAPPGSHGHHHGHGGGSGLSISIHDGKVEVDGIEDMVQSQLDSVSAILDSNPSIPPDVRDRVKQRVEKVRAIVKKRLHGIRSTDLDKIGPEMEKMGDEIDKVMEGLDGDLSQLGDKVGKQFAKQFGKDFAKKFDFSSKTFDFAPHGALHVMSKDDSDDDGDDNDSDDDDQAAVPVAPDVDIDTDNEDLKEAIGDLKSMALSDTARASIAQARAESDRKVADAKAKIDQLSSKLHDALGNAETSETEIIAQVDAISAQEAAIRKARILAWVRARSALDKGQRKLVEAAAKKTHR